jgi:hypothetical protein
MNDTSPEIEAMVKARMMSLSGEDRLRMGVEMFEVAKRMVLSSLPPGLSREEQKRQLYQRIYGEPFPVNATGTRRIS